MSCASFGSLLRREDALADEDAQGNAPQANNYTLDVDLGQSFTRLDVEATAGSFSIVSGTNNSGPPRSLSIS